MLQILILAVLLQAPSDAPLSGVVRLNPPFPKPRVNRPLQQDLQCAKCYGQDEPPMKEDLLLDAEGRVKNAFVAITKGLEGRTFKPPAEEVLLDQKRCVYAPHVLGVQVGQKLRIRNSDEVLHNIHGEGFMNPGFNKAQPAGHDEVRVFQTPELMFQMKCDIHPWMSAHIGVMEHPYFAVSDAAGRFEIKGLPAGKYSLTIWHERAEKIVREIEAPLKGPLDFVLTLRKD